MQEAPLVGTGVEELAARDTGRMLMALEAGEVVEADARHIVVKNKDGKRKNTHLQHSNVQMISQHFITAHLSL